MAEIIDEAGKINYDLALYNLRAFLYGTQKIDTQIHYTDLRFYRRHWRLVLRSLSLPLISKIFSLWRTLGYRILHRYFQLNVIALNNKLKARQSLREDST
jgi:hypothetical protein